MVHRDYGGKVEFIPCAFAKLLLLSGGGGCYCRRLVAGKTTGMHLSPSMNCKISGMETVNYWNVILENLVEMRGSRVSPTLLHIFTEEYIQEPSNMPAQGASMNRDLISSCY